MMNKTLILFFIFSLLTSLVPLSMASDSHDHSQQTNDEHDAHGHDAHGHDDEGKTHINSNMAEKIGITTALAGPQSLHQTITSFGRLTTGPEQTSHVRARFPGVIKSVQVTIGDQVKTGDLLAVVESNESLKKYEVRAPISGTITQRHANTGEMTQEQVLFSIVNFESLWAELRIFPSQQKSLTVGQSVHIMTGDQQLQATISHLLPAEDVPYIIARAQLNGSEKVLFPGLMIEGRIVVNAFDTALAVQNDGLQTLGELKGVFIKHDDEYIFTPLVMGRSDDKFTEVISGINKESEYVIKNSYLIKADIEKSEAEHEH